MDREIFYVMKECGCRITEEGLIYKVLGTRGRCRICIEHGNPIDHRETYCTVCNEIFEQSKSGKISDFCPVCRHINHLENVAKGKVQKGLIQNGLNMVDNGCKFFQNVCGGCTKPAFECNWDI